MLMYQEAEFSGGSYATSCRLGTVISLGEVARRCRYDRGQRLLIVRYIGLAQAYHA